MSNSGVMQFTLGLSTAAFGRALESAGAKMGSFTKSLATFTGVGLAVEAGMNGLTKLGNVVEGVMGAIEKGAALDRLSKVTGESVANLYLLQKGLKAVGLDASGSGNMVLKLQRSLGGINEEGLPTAHIFAQLGLSIEDLKRLDAPTALQAIARSLSGLNNASATAAAGQIFGRESARDFLAMARSSKEFGESLKENAAGAAQMERNAAAFERLERTFERLKDKSRTIFAALAADITPTMQRTLDWLNKIDFKRISDGISKTVFAVAEAFKEGKLGELIGDSLKLALDTMLAYAPAVFEKLGEMLLRAFETPLTYLQAAMEHVLFRFQWRSQHPEEAAAMDQRIAKETWPLIQQRNKATGAFGVLGGGDVGAAAAINEQIKAITKRIQDETMQESFQGVLKERRQEGLRFNLGSGDFGLEDINKDAQQRLVAAQAAMSGRWAEFLYKAAELAGRFPKGQGPDDEGKRGGGVQKMLGAYRPDTTSLQKMGFVMFGASGSDPAKETAKNTYSIAQDMRRIVNSFNTGRQLPASSMDFANIA